MFVGGEWGKMANGFFAVPTHDCSPVTTVRIRGVSAAISSERYAPGMRHTYTIPYNPNPEQKRVSPQATSSSSLAPPHEKRRNDLKTNQTKTTYPRRSQSPPRSSA